jgi:hypothetical protein
MILGKCPTCGRGQTRTSEQNRKLHAMCQDIARQKKWAGEFLDVEDWKRLFVAAIYGQKVVPSLEGHGFVVLNKKTSRMLVDECTPVIEYIQAWAVDNDVELKEDD